MTSGWQGESKRHSIAKKYGRVGSKKIEACKLSSISSKERYERFKCGEDLTREEFEEILRSDPSLDRESREAIKRHLFVTRRPRLGEKTDLSKASDDFLKCVFLDERACDSFRDAAAKELKKRGLNKIGGAHYTKNYERRRILSPKKCIAKSFRTQKFGSTKSARVACRLKKSGKWATQSVLIYRGEPKARKQRFRKMSKKLIKQSRGL